MKRYWHIAALIALAALALAYTFHPAAVAWRLKPRIAQAWLADPVMKYCAVESVILEYESGNRYSGRIHYSMREHKASVPVTVEVNLSSTDWTAPTPLVATLSLPGLALS